MSEQVDPHVHEAHVFQLALLTVLELRFELVCLASDQVVGGFAEGNYTDLVWQHDQQHP